MKKKLLLLGIAFLISLAPLAARADELVDMAKKMYPHDNVQAINRPKSSLVIDGSTGDVVWEDNVDEVRDPASMSKLMTLYLVFEAIKEKSAKRRSLRLHLRIRLPLIFMKFLIIKLSLVWIIPYLS